MASMLRLYVYLEGHGDSFRVTIEDSEEVIDLKEAILKECPNDLKGIDACRLTLYKIDIPDGEDLMRRAIDAPKEALDVSSCELSEIFPIQPPEETVNIFVKVRSIITSATVAPLALSHPQTEMVPTTADRTEFTIKLRGFESWDRLCEDDLSHSDIRQAGLSQFLQEFQEHLGRKRYVVNATQDRLRDYVPSCFPLTILDSYFEHVDPLPAETNISKLDRVTMTELAHYSIVFCALQLRNKVHYDKDKEAHVRALLLEFFSVQQLVPGITCDFGSELPFHLIIELNDGGENLRYTPRSDFHVSIRDFPHVLLQVNSQANGGDEYRMLLQAACIARMGNWLRASTSDKPIVIMAIYIDKQFNARQHILCQPDVGSIEVEYVSKAFDLTLPPSAFEFIFQLYNFFSVAEADNACLHRPESRLAEAKQSVAKKYYKTFTKRKNEENAKSSAKKSNPNPNTSAQGGEEDSFGNPSVQQEVSRAGYILTQPIPEEFTLLTPLKPSMRQATSRSGVRVVLKTVVDSNERRLLHYFSGIKAPSNHTIPLLDVIDLSIGKTLIVLPWKSPLDEVLRFRDRPDDVVSLCLQFIEGVAFLHQHNVAHCDLKPGNVVVDTKSESKVSPRLFIIDLDLALSVEGEESLTEGWCGTPPWIAPEVGFESGPIQQYSPILADRWACGRMIEYFAKYFPNYEAAQKSRLLAFAQRLLDVNPRARPELNQLQAIHGPRKRKAAES